MKRLSKELTLVFVLGLATACSGGDEGANKLEVVTRSLPDVQLNATYDRKIEAKGGTPPYTFSISSGALPTGIELKAQTGQLSGIAAEPGRAAFQVTVADAGDQSVAQDLTLYVIPDPLSIVTTVLPSGKENTPYDQALVARGGVPPYAWSLDAGALPSGLSIVAGGRVMGTPSESGGFDFQAKVADAEDGARLQMLHLFVVSENPVVKTSTIPKAREGEPYSTSLIAEGGTPPYSWEHVAGTLPAGLQLANDGSLTGLPQEAGDFPFTARVSDSGLRQDMVDLVLRVIAPLEITTTALPQIIIGRSIDTMVTAQGGEPPYVWTATGNLPSGITFESTGHLFGTSPDVGVFPLTLRVQDSEGFRDSGLFELRVTDRYTYEVDPMMAFPPTCGTSTDVSSILVPIPVTDSMMIDDLDVGVTLTYTNVNSGANVPNDELKLQLVSPGSEAQAPLCGDGAEVPGGVDCLGSGGIDQVYDDEGAPVNRPDRPLSVFKGFNPVGTWYLRVAVATPSCNRSGVVENVTLSIRDDRQTDDYVIVRGFTRNNLIVSPFVRVTTGTDHALDQHDLYLTATIYSVGPNGAREGGAGDDVPNAVPLTWQWTGTPITGTTVSADGHVHAGAVTGQSTLTASGGGYVINVPLLVTPPDWNPRIRIP